MPGLTRAQSRAAFDHILNNVFERGDDSSLKIALLRQGINDITTLANIRKETIGLLQYEDTRDEVTTLKTINLGDQSLMLCFRDYIVFRKTKGDPIEDGWTEITQEDFDNFRVDPDYIQSVDAPPPAMMMAPRGLPMPPRSPRGPPPTSGTAHSSTPADLFRRGIKRDSNLFPTLKDERFNDTWHRSFANQARAQGVSEILDASFVPTGTEQVELFREKQMYMYAVLESKVITDKGKAIVRRYEESGNAQKVYAELVEHHLRSTKAMIESSTILSYITSVRLGNGEWQGTTEGFILHWQNQVRLYERQVPVTDHFSDGQMRTMLENAVAPVEELRQVKNNGDLHKTKTGEALTYDEYSSLLLSAAVAYDSQFKSNRRATKQRSVYTHNFNDDYDDDNQSYVDGEFYDIDYPIQAIQANLHDRKFKPMNSRKSNFQKRPTMNRDRWYSLSDHARKIWDQLDDKEKAIILGIAPVEKAPPRKTNLHEISAFDFLQANLHEIDTGSEEDTEEISDFSENINVTETEITDSTDDTRLINAATSKPNTEKLAPGDIRRVISKNSKRTVKMADIADIDK